VRLSQQAYEQGGLLSNCDLAELLNTSDAAVAQVLAEHERATGKIVPRRATLHDVVTGLTHKRIICHKRFVEGKEPHLIAQETYHSLEAVDRYLGQYDRVRHCRLQGMTDQEIAAALNCSLSLVNEYLCIDQELETHNHD
jgi:DNA-binding CsgD family transcriptional regulator